MRLPTNQRKLSPYTQSSRRVESAKKADDYYEDLLTFSTIWSTLHNLAVCGRDYRTKTDFLAID